MLALRDAGQHGMVRTLDLEVVPAHMRDLEAGVGRVERHHLPLDPAEALLDAVFEPAFGHQLHADADAHERGAVLQHGFFHGFDQAGDGADAGHAVGEGADARQHDAVGPADGFGVVGDGDGGADAGFSRGTFEGFRGRPEIAGAVIDDCYGHGLNRFLAEGPCSDSRGARY